MCYHTKISMQARGPGAGVGLLVDGEGWAGRGSQGWCRLLVGEAGSWGGGAGRMYFLKKEINSSSKAKSRRK